MSFFRHEEIYRPMDSRNVPGRPRHDRPRPHRYDEFPAGYSSAGCAPAEPASASPAEAHLAGFGSSSTIELQRTVNRLLTPCLTQGDNPSIHPGRLHRIMNQRSFKHIVHIRSALLFPEFLFRLINRLLGDWAGSAATFREDFSGLGRKRVGIFSQMAYCAKMSQYSRISALIGT